MRASAVALCAVAAVGCTRPSDDDARARGAPAPELARDARALMSAPWLAGADRVAAARVDGTAFVVAAGTGFARVFDARGTRVREVPSEPGGAQVLEVIDVAGGPALVVGRGRHRDAQAAPASLMVYRRWWTDAPIAEPVPLPPTSRRQVVWAIPRADAPGLWVGSYESKYMVAVSVATRAADGVWSTARYGTVRVATGAAAVGGDLIVSRAYGDSIEQPGVVVTLAADGTQTPLPSVRGARQIAAVPGQRAVVFADGWHREYARKAQAFIARADFAVGRWARTELTLVPERHGYDRLRVGDVDGDGRADVVAAGNGPAVWIPVAGGAQTAVGSGNAVDAFPFDLDRDGRDELIIAGAAPAIW